MSKRDPLILLEDILTAMERIKRYTDGLTREQFLSDERTIDTAVRNLEIIGEAVCQLPGTFKERNGRQQIKMEANRQMEFLWQERSPIRLISNKQPLTRMDEEKKVWRLS
jgi:uncharacterized protein with HEPN domain